MKGQTVIELTDVKSGEVTKIEDSNFLTSAIQELCNPTFKTHDTLEAISFREEGVCSLEALTRGLMLFDDVLEENTNIYFPPSSVGMVGHAGTGTYLGSDATMGSFNVSQSTLNSPTEKSYVWDFTAEQANGIIKSVCLTSQTGGHIGNGTLTPPEKADASLKSFSNIIKSKLVVQYPEEVYLYTRLPVYISLRGDYLLQIDLSKISTGELLFNKTFFDSKRIDLFNTFAPINSIDDSRRGTSYIGHKYSRTEVITKTIPSDFTLGVNFGMAQDGRYLYFTSGASQQESSESNAWGPGNELKLLKIDLEALTFEVLSVVNTTGRAISIRVPYTALSSAGNTFAVADSYMFVKGWVNSSGKTELYAINLRNNTDVKQITDAEGRTQVIGSTSQSSFPLPFIMNMSGKVCFLDTTARVHLSDTQSLLCCVSTKDFKVAYMNTPISSVFSQGPLIQQSNYEANIIPTDIPLYFGSDKRSAYSLSATSTIHLCVVPNYLATVNNLTTPVEKTPAQTMRITYKLMKE